MNNLGFLRRKGNLTQMDLAVRLGTHVTVISRLETGYQQRAPKWIEDGLREVFGEEWSLERLLQPIDALAGRSNHQEEDSE